MNLRFGNLIRVWKVIHIDVKNEVRTLFFEGALLQALFFKKWDFWKKLLIFFFDFLGVKASYSKSLAPSNKVDSSLGVVVLEW